MGAAQSPDAQGISIVIPAHNEANVIGRTLDRDRYPLADGPDVLSRHRQLEAPQAAVVMSERDMVRFNRGLALGGSCGAADRPQSATTAWSRSTRTSVA